VRALVRQALAKAEREACCYFHFTDNEMKGQLSLVTPPRPLSQTWQHWDLSTDPPLLDDEGCVQSGRRLEIKGLLSNRRKSPRMTFHRGVTWQR
jgi:hypothetical protein